MIPSADALSPLQLVRLPSRDLAFAVSAFQHSHASTFLLSGVTDRACKGP